MVYISSQVFTYNTAADSTLPSVSKKRKLVDGAEERPSKLLKIEPVDGAGDASAVGQLFKTFIL